VPDIYKIYRGCSITELFGISDKYWGKFPNTARLYNALRSAQINTLGDMAGLEAGSLRGKSAVLGYLLSEETADQLITRAKNLISGLNSNRSNLTRAEKKSLEDAITAQLEAPIPEGVILPETTTRRKLRPSQGWVEAVGALGRSGVTLVERSFETGRAGSFRRE
jgi:hypothetical protein